MLERSGDTWLIVGLGNPGREYENTRHNAGFRALDILAQKLGCKPDKLKYQGLYCQVNYRGNKLLLLKPQTYMNLSGECVRQLLDWYKCPSNHLVVIYDDIDLPLGKLRVRKNGSAGTHNGMRSIIGETGLQNFARIRIGIRDEAVNIPIINYVLAEVHKDDYPLFAEACQKAGAAAAEFVKGLDIEKVMCKYN